MTALVRDITVRESDGEILGEIRRTSALAISQCIVSRYATVWAEKPGRSTQWSSVLDNLVMLSVPTFAGRNLKSLRHK